MIRVIDEWIDGHHYTADKLEDGSYELEIMPSPDDPAQEVFVLVDGVKYTIWSAKWPST